MQMFMEVFNDLSIYCTKMQESKVEHKKHNMQRKREI